MKRILVFICLMVFFITLPAYSDTGVLDLSVAVGDSNSTYRASPERWELARVGLVQIVEGQSDLLLGTFTGTKLNDQGKVILNVPASCSGTFVSKVFDLSTTAGDELLSYYLYIPSGTSASIYLRHGSSPSGMGDWTQVSGQNFALRDVIGKNNYFQYKVEFGSNSSCNSSPQFGGVTITWNRFSVNPGRVSTAKVDDIYASLVKGIWVTQDVPEGTRVRWAISDDNGASIKKFQNGTWVTIASGASITASIIDSNGNTKDELESIPVTAWKSLKSGFFRVFFSLKSSVDYLSPSVSSIEVDYDPPQVEISSFSCNSKLYVAEPGICNVVSRTNIGNLAYQWSGPADMQINPQGSTASISFSAQGRKTVKVRSYINEIPGTYQEKTFTIDVSTPPKPRIVLEGPKGVMLGEKATYKATVTCPERMTCAFRFLVDNETYGDQTIEVLFRELGKHSVIAQAWDPNLPGSLGESVLSVYVSEVSKPFISFNVPKKVELGVPFTASVRLTATYGNPTGYWILPDGTNVSGDTVTYTANRKVNDLKLKYVAWIEGFDYTRTTVESPPIVVDVYEMPQFTIKSFQKLDKPIYAPYGAFFGVNGNIGIPKEFGVTLTHQWDFGDGTIIEGGDPGRAGHTYTEAGTYTVTLRVFDDRGNESVDSIQITILDPPPVVVDFKVVASNKYNRAPLKVFLKPVVTGGHPALDKLSSYSWSINGVTCSDARMLNVTFNEPGEYAVTLRVETKTGKIAEGTKIITANPNRLPECTISYQDYPKYKYTKIISSCKDPDGKIKKYFWELGDGTTSESANVFAKYENSGTYDVTLTVTDDSGEQAVFSIPVTVER